MTTTPPQANDQPVKRWVILILGSLIVIAMAYGSGLRQGTRAVRQARAELKTARSETAVARAEAAERENTIRQLEARRQLHLTLLELDRRNFGTAQRHLSTAAILLGNVKEAGADLAGLVGQIKASNIVAAGDFGAQRERVLEFARRLDTLLSGAALPGPDMGEAPEGAP